MKQILEVLAGIPVALVIGGVADVAVRARVRRLDRRRAAAAGGNQRP